MSYVYGIYLCRTCGESKPYIEFCGDAVKYKLCKACARVRDNERYAANKEKYAARNKQQTLKHKYGLTIEAYTAMLQVQFYKCASCGEKFDTDNVCVDHDHTTNEVRELLCRSCNSLAIGDVDRLEKVVAYLKRHGK